MRLLALTLSPNPPTQHFPDLLRHVLPTAHFDTGWPVAVADLSGEGGRVFVSPWVTAEALELGFRGGDKLLLRGSPWDFVQGASDLATLERLINTGVSVRVNARVHAKVYLRLTDGGAVGWLGSANLTHNGSGANIEAMAGPFLLARAFVEEVLEL